MSFPCFRSTVMEPGWSKAKVCVFLTSLICTPVMTQERNQNHHRYAYFLSVLRNALQFNYKKNQLCSDVERLSGASLDHLLYMNAALVCCCCCYNLIELFAKCCRLNHYPGHIFNGSYYVTSFVFNIFCFECARMCMCARACV